MTERKAGLSRYKTLLVECGAGLYGAIGGLQLGKFGTLILLFHWVPESSRVARWFSTHDPAWIVNFGLWIIAAILVAVWLDSALGARRLSARLTAALVFGLFLLRMASRRSWWSSQPAGWSLWFSVTGLWIIAAILAMLLLALLPTLRRFRFRVKPTLLSYGRVMLYILPLLAMLPAWSFNIGMRAKIRPLGERISQVHLPVPPDAESVVQSGGPVAKVVSFTLRERYPSAAVAQFYQQHFTAEGWHQDYQSDWEDSGGYSPRGSQGKMSYLQSWESPDGALSCYLSINYQTPWGTDPDLPLAEWDDDWLEVQHVRVFVMPEESLWGPG